MGCLFQCFDSEDLSSCDRSGPPHTPGGAEHDLMYPVSSPNGGALEFPPQQQQQHQDTVHVIAKYSYTASESSELSIKKGEKLVLVDSNGEWWRVRNQAKLVGKVPSNYVEIDSGKKSKKESFFKKILKKDKKPVTAQKDVSLPYFNSFPPPATDESSTNGYTISAPVPGSFGIPSPPQGHAVASGGLSPKPLGGLDTATAIYNYKAQQPDELDLCRGDKVTVLQRSDDGWWNVQNGAGRSGWIPSNYLNVQSSSETSSPDLAASDLRKVSGGGGGGGAEAHVNGGGAAGGDRSRARSGSRGSAGGPDANFMFGVRVVYNFEAQEPNELSCVKNELLDVIGEPTNDRDWWQARNNQGLMGLVPKKFVQEMPDAAPVYKRQSGTGSAGGARGSTSPRSTGIGIKLEGAGSLGKGGGSHKDREWFYGRITRNDCEKLFEECGENGDFVVRESESNPGDFSISLKAWPKNRHFHVQLQAEDGRLLIGSKTFANLDEIIQHYRTSPIYTDAQGTRLFLIKPLRTNQPG